MRLGIFAKTFAGSDPGTVLAASKAAGFAGVQYNMACSGLAAMPDALSAQDVAAVAAASAADGRGDCGGVGHLQHDPPRPKPCGPRAWRG